MPVEISDGEFQFLYDAFEQLMSPTSTRLEIIEAIKLENVIWHWLTEVVQSGRFSQALLADDVRSRDDGGGCEHPSVQPIEAKKQRANEPQGERAS